MAPRLSALVARLPGPAAGAITTDAIRYDGAGYVYGGRADRPGDWDCSSFVSYVLGHDLHIGLPGGRWGDPGMPPNVHGPVVMDYATWRGAVTVPGPPRGGDLCCWVGEGAGAHIGFALGANEMISAYDTQQGTLRTQIQGAGPAGAPLIFRRVVGVAGGPGYGGGGAAGPAPAAAGIAPVLALALTGLFVAATAGILVVGAAALAAAASAGMAALASAARSSSQEG